MHNRMSKQSKKKIRESFFELMRFVPYDKITVTDIVDGAGVSRRTFYRLFKDKKDILNQYLDQVMREWISYSVNQRIKLYSDLIDIIFDFLGDYVEDFTILIQAGLSTYVLDKFNEALPNYIETLHQNSNSQIMGTDKQKISWQEDKYIFFLSIGSIWNVYSEWLMDSQARSINDLRETVKLGFNILGQ